MPWDPLDAWPNERRWIWATLALWLLVLRGPAFIENLRVRPPEELIPDFFQEYASARNRLEGLPIYANQHETVPRYLGRQLDDRRSHVMVNAHPPAAVLLALPLARLDFAAAFLAWNLVSLAALAASFWIVQRQLKIPFSVCSFAVLVALLLLCFPLWEQCRLGQLTLVLLLLVTGAWAAERSGYSYLAGSLLGTAAMLKLFPGFLLLYYALRVRWKVVAAALLTIAVLLGLTAMIFGINAYRTYFVTVLPGIQWFRVGWNNDSFWGFWSRLFDPAPEHGRDRSLTEPLLYSPILAKALSLISSAAVVAILAWAVRRDASDRKGDLTFALAVTAMLLISPICWDHYLLLLLVPLAVVWTELPESRFARTIFLVIVTAFWVGYPLVWTAFDLNGRAATPIQSLGVLSYQFYALLGLFGLLLRELRQREGRDAPSSVGGGHILALGAFFMATLWTHVLWWIWQEYGLFYFVGGDFGIYRSIAQAVLSEGPRAMYDLDLVAPYARELMVFYGPRGQNLNLGPGPYPAVYILPFLLLNAFSSPVGYLIWTASGIALAIAAVRGMAARWPEAGRGLVASSVLFFPIVDAMIYGQLTMLFFYGFYRAYRSLERGDDFRAGLWSGALYLKPQYPVFLFLVFLLKRRWRALGGLMLTGLVVLLGSLAIVGLDGLRAHYETLRAFSGFRDVPPIAGPDWMINWRGLLVNFLPDNITETTGKLVTAILSILTVGTLPLIWRGAWDPRSERFAVQMLATVIVMMMASYHNHVHSAALLLIPGMAAAAQSNRPRFLRTLLLAGLFVPLPFYFLTASMMRVSWLFIALMRAALGTILYAELGLDGAPTLWHQRQLVQDPHSG